MKDFTRDALTIENGRIFFRNFSGTQTKFNPAGKRNFCVEITDPAIAGALIEDGWNVRTLTKRDEDEDERYYIQVNVSYTNRPPAIYLITRTSRTLLSEDSIGSLDYADIRCCDMIISPYQWDISGRKGIKGYLKTIYVVLEEDEFADKYRMPDNCDDEDILPF